MAKSPKKHRDGLLTDFCFLGTYSKGYVNRVGRPFVFPDYKNMADPALAEVASTMISTLLKIAIPLLAITGIFALIMRRFKGGQDEGENGLEEKASYQPYEKREYIFSSSEFKFYNILKELLGDKYEIFAKMRIADIVKPKSGDGEYSAFNRIKSKHVDFLICYKDSAKPKIAIELDGSSHDNWRRQKRDKFVDEVFTSAGIPLAHIRVREEYDREEIIKQLRKADRSKYVVKQKED